MELTLAMLARVLVERGASDVVMTSGNRPACRVSGKIEPIPSLPAMARGQLEAFCLGLVGAERYASLASAGKLNLLFALGALGTVRVLIVHDPSGPRVMLSLARPTPAPPAPARPTPAPPAPARPAPAPPAPAPPAPPPRLANPASELLDVLLGTLLDRSGSDAHLKQDHSPTLRIDGELTALAMPPLDRPIMLELIALLIGPQERRTFLEVLQFDMAYLYKDRARFRVNLYHDHCGLGIAMRLIPARVPSCQDIGLPDTVRGLVRPHGLLLITGPTGSGKTTTVASLIRDINEREYRHILTVENPIEFVFQDDRCSITQREVPIDSPSFSEGVIDALRQDADVILVGDMRDPETMSAALTAADAGKMVLATCHTSSAFQTVERILNAFPADQQPQVKFQLASNLTGIVSQVLLPRRGGGRVLAVEILASNDAVRAAIRAGRPQLIQSAMETGSAQGMQALDQHLHELVARGAVSFEHAMAKCQFPQNFKNPLDTKQAA